MWRLWVLVLVGPVWAEGDLGEEDAGYLEQRLDDLRELGAAAVRWRVRGAEMAWEQWQLYQRVEVAPVSGQAFFGLAERDRGESGWSDLGRFTTQCRRGGPNGSSATCGPARARAWCLDAAGAGVSRRGCRPETVGAWGIAPAGRTMLCAARRGATRVGRGPGCCSGAGRAGMGVWTNRARCAPCPRAAIT